MIFLFERFFLMVDFLVQNVSAYLIYLRMPIRKNAKFLNLI
jgi:hypothetical protein